MSGLLTLTELLVHGSVAVYLYVGGGLYSLEEASARRFVGKLRCHLALIKQTSTVGRGDVNLGSRPHWTYSALLWTGTVRRLAQRVRGRA